MNENNFNRFLSFMFIIGLIASAVVFNASKPRIMILHSYHPDYPWTRDIDAGIQRISKNWTGYALTLHYMDTKKHSDKEWLRHAGIGARRAIDRFNPDVLIAVDDLAQDLAARYYVDHPCIKIVFSGINSSAVSYGYDGAQNVTGIYEWKPLNAVKEMIINFESAKYKPNDTPNIVYLMDPSPSMAGDRNFFETFNWAPLIFKGSMIVKNFKEWKIMVSKLDQLGVDYLLVANYRKLPRSDEDSRLPSPQEIMKWTEANSTPPVIGLNIFNVEDGGMIAVGASPFEQGEIAAKMAEIIVKQNISPKDIPKVVNRQYIVAVNQQLLKKRNLKLPQIYEAFARVTSTYVEGYQ